MLRKLLSALALVVASVSAQADLGTIDRVPAATILVPYFEAAKSATDPRNTIVELHSATATAVLAHVTLWTDVGIPVHSFNIYLTGYDQQTINLKEVLNGAPPRTASAGQDPTNQISPKGIFSQDINFASCNGYLPDGIFNVAPPDLFQALSGQAAPDTLGGNCGGRNFNDGLARGFITIDTVNNCTLRLPGQVGYFVGDITFQNVMVADFHLFDSANRRLLSESAVHIEANNTAGPPPTSSFYGFAGSASEDRRETLPNEFLGKFAQARTSLLYWRQPASVPAPFACGSAAPDSATGQFLVSGFDANGGATPAATGNFFNSVAGSVSGSTLNYNSALGSFDTNLNLADSSRRQAWVLVRQVPTTAPATADYGYMSEATHLNTSAR